MLELRLLNRVPNQAAALAFVQSKPLSVLDNISLVDYSRDHQANAVEYFQTAGTVESTSKSIATRRSIFSDQVILSNRSVVSPALSEGASLYYKYPLGKFASLRIIADSGSISVVVTSTTITINSQAAITWTGKTVREVAKEINDQTANLVAAYVVCPTISNFATGSFTATTSGIVLNNASFYKVYAPDASTTDLVSAKDTIRKQLEVLVDGQKTNEVLWDISVDSYSSNGFLVYLYTDRKNIDGKSYQIRYRGITASGTIQNSVVEVINALPELLEDADYTITAVDNYYEVTTSLSGAPALAIFGSGTLDVTVTTITVTVGSLAQAVTITGKSLRQVAAELQEALPAHKISLLSDRAALDGNSIATQAGTTLSVYGTLVLLNQDFNLLYGPDARIHPLLPYEESPYKPWHPRITVGRFSELLYDSDIGYGQSYGSYYGGSTKSRYNYGVPEYSNQAFKDSLGEPYRSIAFEQPIVVSEKILRTRRFPIESLGSIELYSGETLINDSITDVDLEQGFIFLDTRLAGTETLSVNYVYAERSLVYAGVDLNTTNNPDLIGKFVGLYCLPETIAGVNWTPSGQTIHHLTRDTVEEIVTELSALALSTGTLVNPILVGIYQTIPTEDKTDVKFLPAAPLGGGIKEGVPLEGEARFVADEGRWDGEAFDADQTLILELPSTVIPTGDATEEFYIDHTVENTFMSPAAKFTREDIESRSRKWVPPGFFLIVEP